MAAYGAAVSLFEALSQLLANPRYLHQHLDIFIIRVGVNTFKRFLLENREVNRDFEHQIRESIYEAQDIIGNHMWSAHFLSPSEAEISKQRFGEDLGRMVQKIISVAQMTTMEAFDHQTLDRKISNLVWKPSAEILHTRHYPLVGRDKDFEQLMNRLTSGSAGLEVIPVSGVAGIGKTLLAYHVLGDSSIRNHFEVTGLVTISIKYDKRNTLLDLLGSIKDQADGIRAERSVRYEYNWGDAINQKTNDQLVKHIHDSLKYKRYFVVLDDIREVEIWNDLKEIFPDYYNGSRILITTRSVDVGAAHPHVLDFVSNEDTLDLLVAIAFDGEPCPPHLAVIAKDIASSCRGFPHAVVIVGNLLSFARPIVEYWEIVLSSIESCRTHVEVVEALVLLTYNHLPQQLKICLLYMAIFPHNYGFGLMEIIRLLVAERFAEETGTLFSSIAELGCRSFFAVRLKSRKIYSPRFEIAEEVFHDFLVRKAKEEKFFLVINKDTSYDLVQDYTIYNQQRRLCIHQNIHHFIKDVSAYSSNSFVRSLLYYGPKNQYPLRSWPEGFKLLEVFDAVKVSFYTFPQILKLVQLRYLALSYNQRIPATVFNLRNLQFLIVSQYLNLKCSGVPSYLPAEIWNLRYLWLIKVMGSDLPEPPPGNDLLLPKLHTVSDVSSHSCSRNILARIRNLQTLRVRIESLPADESLSFFSHLDILSHLTEFKCIVQYPDIGSQVLCSSIPAFPATLKNLTLSGCGFPWEYISAIVDLPNLETLKLQTYAFRGPVWEVKTSAFAKLFLLMLEDMDLENWTFASGTGSSFPALKSLIINHCYKLQDIPSVFADSPALEVLEVVDCSTSAMNSALEIKKKILKRGRRPPRFGIYSSKDD